jgi:hypothetical protein
MVKIFSRKLKFIIGASALAIIFAAGSLAIAATDATAGTSDVPIMEIAPGEFLPIAVKLTNFGGKKEVSVLVNYEIQDGSGKVFFRLSETVPVETTVSFVKNIQLPITLPSGQYIAFSKIIIRIRPRRRYRNLNSKLTEKLPVYFWISWQFTA